MGVAPYTAGETIDADDAGVVALGKQDSDNTFQILKTEPHPSLASIALGQVTGWNVLDKFGKNADIDSSFVPVLTSGSTVLLTSPETFLVFSDTVNDALAGTGAQKILLEGLDGQYNEISEEIDTNGTVGTFTSQTFLRMHRAKVTQVGTHVGSTNIGEITITATTTTTSNTLIIAGEGQTQMAQYTIPASKTGFFDLVFFAGTSNVLMTGQLQVRPFGQGWQTKHELISLRSHVVQNMSGSGEITEKSDIRWMGKAAQVNSTATAGFKILLRDD
jgi:hypothetical protein